jgi:hypothetical protein
MSGQTNVAISLATYKAIEAQRMNFAERHDAIIRRALADRGDRRARMVRAAALTRGAPRRRGRVSVTLFGEVRPAMNLRDAYLIALTGLVRHQASLLNLLANEGSTARRWVATSAEALFVSAPHLAIEHAHMLTPGWFVDTNVSRAQIIARLTVAAQLAGYRYGEDVEVVEG